MCTHQLAHQCFCVPRLPTKAAALLLQMQHPFGSKHVDSASLPMALLTSIVRKEAQLPNYTAVFAATQLLPVIQAAADWHSASRDDSLDFGKELLVSAQLATIVLHTVYSLYRWTCSQAKHPHKSIAGTALVNGIPQCTGVALSQVMCSYMTASSAWPVLLRHRPLLALAASVVRDTADAGQLLAHPAARPPSSCTPC